MVHGFYHQHLRYQVVKEDRKWLIPWASHTPALAGGARGDHTLATGASAVGELRVFLNELREAYSQSAVHSVARIDLAHSFSHSE